jgi:catechol 2,3-dioxygenase-like lactoylglutathione lyase family enzyme
MARGLDHIVHAVSDLDAAADFYARAGFRVGARNRHPPVWGTQNHIVQLPGFFIEPLALADMSATAPHGERYFSFGAFNRDFLARGQGLSMLVLEGDDSAAEARAFRTAGFGDFALFDFARDAKRPDGTPTKVAFTLAFARDPKAPDIGCFTCRQHHPENFWNPAFQHHANGAVGIAGIVLVADLPEDHRAFLSAFTGAAEVSATASGIVAKTSRGEIVVTTPAIFTHRFGVAPPDTARGARLAALRFAMRDIATARAALQAGKIGFSEQARRLVVGPELAFGATLVFEAAG